MIKTRRKRLLLPTELAIVEKQLRDGNQFKFTLRWEFYQAQARRPFRGKISTWMSDSMDDLLAAVERVEIELERTPGIERALTQHRKCVECGRIIPLASVHTADQCANAREFAAELFRAIGRSNLDKENEGLFIKAVRDDLLAARDKASEGL